MNYRTWHGLNRWGFLVMMPAVAAGFLMPPGPVQAALLTVGVAFAVVSGVAGAALAILMIAGRFRFACPACGEKNTHLCRSERGRGMELHCGQCGTFREGGLFRLRLRLESLARDASPEL
ncbi:MAG: hypothetical protein ACK5TY_03625 [Verrucomicrobiota bacterium]|jgi:predicted RNA-binding Zn-ribbon protein involved in translation (DUF1610 family)